MNSVHDIGGHHGFGPIEREAHEPVFHERWEGRVFGMSLSLAGRKAPNLDAARHRGERLNPVTYFKNGYYGRWLAAFEMMLHEDRLLGTGELEARLAGQPPPPTATTPTPPPPARSSEVLRGLNVVREIPASPKFAPDQPVMTRNHQPAGHTRLPAYARYRQGVIKRVHAAMVFPDTNAHEAGENPQYVYTVAFDGQELWGDVAEPRTFVHLDLFEDYLDAI